jgi:hypothetical protein
MLVSESRYEVLLGSINFVTPSANAVYINSSQIILHENYNLPNSLDNDLALIKLPVPVTLTSILI